MRYARRFLVAALLVAALSSAAFAGDGVLIGDKAPPPRAQQDDGWIGTGLTDDGWIGTGLMDVVTDIILYLR